MKVILLKDIKKIGKAGDILEFNDGYANNFLFPNKLATEASKSNVDKVEAQKKSKLEKESYENKKLDDYIYSLDDRQFEFAENATGEGNLYKHLSLKYITERLSHEISKEVSKLLKFDFNEIGKIGKYQVGIVGERAKSKIIINVIPKSK